MHLCFTPWVFLSLFSILFVGTIERRSKRNKSINMYELVCLALSRPFRFHTWIVKHQASNSRMAKEELLLCYERRKMCPSNIWRHFKNRFLIDIATLQCRRNKFPFLNSRSDINLMAKFWGLGRMNERFYDPRAKFISRRILKWMSRVLLDLIAANKAHISHFLVSSQMHWSIKLFLWLQKLLNSFHKIWFIAIHVCCSF